MTRMCARLRKLNSVYRYLGPERLPQLCQRIKNGKRQKQGRRRNKEKLYSFYPSLSANHRENKANLYIQHHLIHQAVSHIPIVRASVPHSN